MNKTALRRRATALGSAIAALLLFAAAAPSPASADTTRTLKVALSCQTGLPYGMSVNVGSGWYYPNGSSYASGYTKYFTVFIPTSASQIAIDTSYCDGEQSQWWNAPWSGGYASLTPGTSTVNANGYCDFDNYYGWYSRSCSLSNITYS
jgi:hypothetical protein